MTGFDFSGVGQTKLIPVEDDICIPTGCFDDPIHVIPQGLVAFSYAPKGCFVVQPEGEPLVATGAMSDGTLQHFYLDPITGVLMASTGQNLGQPPAPGPRRQAVGGYTYEIHASGGDVDKSIADLIADAQAAGIQMFFEDGTSVVVGGNATDFVARIDVDLKPLGAQVGGLNSGTVTTTSEAVFRHGGLDHNLDSMGSVEVGFHQSQGGFYLPHNFPGKFEISVADGSCVVVSVVFATIPA